MAIDIGSFFLFNFFFCMEVLAISGAPEDDDSGGAYGIYLENPLVVGGSILGKKPEDQQIHCIFFGSVWPQLSDPENRQILNCKNCFFFSYPQNSQQLW